MNKMNQPFSRVLAGQLRFSLPPAIATRPMEPGPSWLRRLWLRAAAAWNRSAQMDELASRTDRELKDIGLVRGDIPAVFSARSIRDGYVSGGF